MDGISIYPSDRRQDLDKNDVKINNTNYQTLNNVRNDEWMSREIKVTKGDGSIKERIAKTLGLQVNNKWFVVDHLEETQLYMIAQTPYFYTNVVAGIPYENVLTKSRTSETWDGLIVDLDDMNFRLPDFYPGEKRVIDEALVLEDDKVIISVQTKKSTVNIEDEYVRGDLSEIISLKNVSIEFFPDAPVVRVWKYKGRILLSSSRRIDAFNHEVDGVTKKSISYGEVYTKLNGQFENLFIHPENHDAVYYFQIVSADLPGTVQNIFSDRIVLVDSINVRVINPGGPTKPINQNEFMLEDVNIWLGLTNPYVDPRMALGDAVIITGETKIDGEPVLMKYHLVPYSQEWRKNLLGNTGNFYLRYLQLCNCRMLPGSDFLKIFPHSEDISTAIGRLHEITKIFSLCVSPQLREEALGLYAKYWGTEGLIWKLVGFLLHRIEQKVTNPSFKYSKEEQNAIAMSDKYTGSRVERLNQLLFQVDPTKPHLDGDQLHTLIKKMNSINKLIEKKQKQ